MAFDTFDTDSVATTGSTFSNGNLTVLGASGYAITASGIAQTIEGKTSGKWYVEITLVTASGNNDGIGIVNSWGIGSRFMGDAQASAPSTDSGWGYFNTNGLIVNKNASVTAVNTGTYTSGDVVCMAIDLDNGRIWWRKNGGSWIGTSGTPNPATNTSGFDISHQTSNGCRVYPAVNQSGSTSKFTANFGATAFAQAVPSGFTSGWTNTTANTYFGTFATSGRGSAVTTPSQNNKAVSKYTATLTGSVTSFIIPYAGATTTDLKGLIYDDTGTGGLPGALLGTSTNTITSGVYGETSFTFSGVSVTSSSNYWFGVVSDSNTTSTLNVSLCPPLTSGIAFNSGTYASPTNPFGASPSTANFRYPIIVNINTAQSFALVGVSGTAAAGTLSADTAVNVNLSGVSATAAAGTLGSTYSASLTLTGAATTTAVGSLAPGVSRALDLVGISVTAAMGALALTATSTVALVGVTGTAYAGILPPTQVLVTVPILTIMNDNPVPVEGDMVGDYVPMEEDMPNQIALETVLNTFPIPMTGTLSAVPIPAEGSVP